MNNSRSKQNNKILNTLFLEIGKLETRAKFQQKILNTMVVGTCQSFQFFRRNAWFLGNSRDLFKVFCQILHQLISIIKL